MSMATVLENFMGMMPKRDKRLLPGNHSQTTTNCKLWSGAIDPMRGPLTVHTPAKKGTVQSFYRMDDREGGSDFWLHWTQDVDAIRGPVADTRQRLYFTGVYEPRVCTYEMAAEGTDTIDGSDNYPGGFGEDDTEAYPVAYYALGVPNPAHRVDVSVSGGDFADITRAYVVTFVNAWGEESGPSRPHTATGAPDGAWAVADIPTVPTQTGSIIHVADVGSEVAIYTDGAHWAARGHRITLASIGGAVEANGDFTLTDAVVVVERTLQRERTSNVATLYLESVEKLKIGQHVVVENMTDSDYDTADSAITAIDIDAKSISYANTGSDEATTADTAGTCSMGEMRISLASITAYTSGGSWTRVAPWNLANMTKRIYRTVTGNAETVYALVAEIDGATVSYSDTVDDVDLGPTLQTEGYDLPDGELHSLAQMANGITAGAYKNEVHFAEQYKPYAWIRANVQPLNWIVVALAGMGDNGQTLIVGTKGAPYRMTGVAPNAIAADDAESIYPCVAKRSMRSLGWAVVYASDQGLVMISPRGTEMVTRQYYNRDEWTKLANSGVFASSMVYDNRYYGFWQQSDGTGACLTFDPQEANSVVTQNAQRVDGAWTDPETYTAYVLDEASGNIGQWDANDARKLTYEWLSKEFKYRKPGNFGAGKLDAEFTTTAEEAAAIATENAAIVARNAAIIAAIPSGASDYLPEARGPAAARAGFSTSVVLEREATTTRARTSNVATIGVADASVFNIGEEVVVHRLADDDFNGIQTLTAVDVVNDTVSYANTGADVGSTADTGGYVDCREPRFVEGGGTIFESLVSAAEQFVQIEIIADGVPFHSVTMTQEGYFRVPTGQKATEYEFRITGNVRCQSVKLAETMRELSSV